MPSQVGPAQRRIQQRAEEAAATQQQPRSIGNRARAFGLTAYEGITGAASTAKRQLNEFRAQKEVQEAQAAVQQASLLAAQKAHAVAGQVARKIENAAASRGLLITATGVRRGRSATGSDPSTSILEFDFKTGEFIATSLKGPNEKSFVVRGKTAADLKTRYDAAAKVVGGRRKTRRNRK